MESFSNSNHLTIVLEDAINIYNADKIKSDINQLIERSKEDLIIIDLLKVSYIDSTGVATLNQIQKSLKQKEKKLIMVNLDDIVDEALNLSGLKGLFTIYKSAQDIPL